MKYLIVIFSFLTLSLSAQRLGGFSIAVFANPESLPATLSNTDNSVSRMAYVKSEGKFYRWDVTNTSTNAGSWSQFTQIDRISAGSPSYTPILGDSPIAINGSGIIYTWNGSSWNTIAGGGGATNLTFSRDGNTVTVISDTGTDAQLPSATQSSAGVLKSTDKILIDSALQSITHDATLIGTGRTGSILQVDTATKIATIYDVSRVDDDFLNSEMNGLTVGNTSTQNAIALNLLLPNRKYIFVPKNVVVDYNQVNLTTVGNRGTHIFDENYGGWIANGGIFKISDNGSTPTFLLSGLRSTDEFNFYLQPGLKYGGTVRSKIDLFARPFIDPLTGINTTDYSTAGILINEPVNSISNNLSSGKYSTTHSDGTIYPLNVKGDRYTGAWSLDINTKVNGASSEFGYTPGIRLTTQDGSFAPFAVYQYKYDGMPQLRQAGAIWRPGLTINSGEYILYNNVNGESVYRSTTSGTTGNTPPTHLTGSVSDGGVTWQYIHDTYSGTNQTGLAVFNGSLQPGSYNIDTSYFKLPANTNTIGAYFNGNNIAFAPQNEDVGVYWFRNGSSYVNSYGQPDFTTGALTSIVHKRNSGDLYFRNKHNGEDHNLRMSSTFMQHIGGSTLLSSATVTSGSTIDATKTDIVRLNYGSPTTITNITGNSNQILYVTSLDGSVTIQHNANINLLKGADLVLQPNIIYTFIRNNLSVWMEVASSLNAWTTTGNTGTNSSTNYIGTNDAQDLRFRTNAAERVTITSAGKIGIGTLTPSGKFHILTGANPSIYSGSTGDLIALFENSNGLTSTPTRVVISSGSTLPATTSQLEFWGKGNGGSGINQAMIKANMVEGSSGGLGVSSLDFSTVNDEVTPITRMKIKSTGQIQIPSYTSTSSFSGTEVGVLAFDATGNILTIPTPSGGGGSSVTTTREDGVITSTSSTTWNPLTANTDRMLDATVNNGFTYTVNLGQAINCQNCEISFSNFNTGITGTGVMFIDGFGSELVGSGGTFTIGAGLGASFKSVNTSGATWEWRRKF